MKVLHIGATGKVGRPILAELVSRGHDVAVLVRNPEPVVEEFPGLRTFAGDAFDRGTVAEAARGREAIVSSVAMRDPGQFERSAVELSRVIAAVALAEDIRWISIGGAGSLEVSPGVQFVDTPEFPDASKRESSGFRAALRELEANAPAELRWTVLSPPPVIDPNGERTGSFRIGSDLMLRAPNGPSRISVFDLAVAVVDELEHAQHDRLRFTVAY